MTQAIDSVVLFGHGSRDPRWAQTMQAVMERLQALAPDLPVRCAYLEFMQPGLPEVLRELHAAGLCRIRISPVFLAAGGHVLRDLPALVAQVQAECPGLAVEIQSALGAAQGVIEALARESLS